MPKFVRLHVVSVPNGFAIAALFVTALLWSDVGGLGRLTCGSAQGWLAGLMLWVFNGSVFAGVQFALAVMSLAGDGGPGGGKPRSAPTGDPVLLRFNACRMDHDTRRPEPAEICERRRARTQPFG